MAFIKKIDLKDGRSRYRLRYTTPDGKPTSETFDLERDAKRRKAQVENEVNTGSFVDTGARKMKVHELGTRLLGTKTDRRNREWYEMMLRLHVYPRWKNVPVAAVTYLDVTTWVAELQTTGRGPDTVRGAFRTLHEVVKLALHSRMIGYDPCLGVKGLPPLERREMLFLSKEQIQLLANTLEERFPGYGWGALVRFTAYSGLRAGEVGALKVKHLDLLRRRVQVVKARKRGSEDGAPKKGKMRWVGIPANICEEISLHLAGRCHGPEDRVWTGERGGPLNHHWFYMHRFKVVVDELSAKGLLPVHDVPVEDGDVETLTLRFHDLRHTCVALLIADGNRQYEVMEHLGHTNIQTTINTYGHLFPEVHARIRESLERTLAEAEKAVPTVLPLPLPESRVKLA